MVKLSAKKIVVIAVLAVPLLLLLADEYPALRFRGDGQFSGGPVFGYSIQLRQVPFYRAGEYVFHLRGMPSREMTLQLYVEGKSSVDNRLELTNLNTQVEALLVDQNGRVICQAAGMIEPCHYCKILPDKETGPSIQKEWMLISGPHAPAYWHENCLRMRFKPSDSYTLTLRILAVDPKTPKIDLIPTLESSHPEL